MAHTTQDRNKLLSRVRRIQGQLRAVESLLQEDAECFKVLQTVSASRGALNGLMAEIIDGHLESHVVSAKNLKEAAQAGEQLREIVRSFWK